MKKEVYWTVVDFVSYLHKNWVKLGSKYPKEMWNVGHLRAHRTNNLVEGWYSYCILRHFGVGRNRWKFIMNLQKLEAQSRAMFRLQEAGERLSTRRLRQKRKERKIEAILCK